MCTFASTRLHTLVLMTAVLSLAACSAEAGPKGAPGEDGADGADGANGVDGEDGADGQDGADGADGQDGADGEDGILDASDVYQVIVYDNIDDGYREWYQVWCDYGDTVLGGGVTISDAEWIDDIYLQGSSPVIEGEYEGWKGMIMNESGSTVTYGVYAICVDTY